MCCPNVLSKCVIKISYRNVLSKCFIKMSHSVLYVLSTIVRHQCILSVHSVISPNIRHPSSINVYFLYFLYFLSHPSSIIHQCILSVKRSKRLKSQKPLKRSQRSKTVTNGKIKIGPKWSKTVKNKNMVKNHQQPS